MEYLQKSYPVYSRPLLPKKYIRTRIFSRGRGGGDVWGAALHSQNPSHPSKKMNIKQIKININITFSFHTSSTEDVKWSEKEIDLLRDPTFLQKVANIEVELFGRFFQLKL